MSAIPAKHSNECSPLWPVGRIAGLDLIRGVAILLVLCRHLHLPPPASGSSWLHQLFFVLQRGGWCGVDLFFVLSGFLVAGILFRQHQSDGTLQINRFLIRRGFKIYPAFWIMLEATILYNFFAGGTVPVVPLCIELSFLQNYFKGIYGHTWSLAVEEHCYLALALLFVILTRLRKNSSNPFRPLPLFTFIGLISTGWMRIRLSPQLESNGPPSILFPTHLRFDGFLAGTALAYLAYYRRGLFARLCRITPALWIVLGGLLLSPVFLFDVRHDPIVVKYLLTTNICVATCWILAAHGTAFRNPEYSRSIARVFIPIHGLRRIIEFLGRHSYSIYLWHDLIEHAFLRPVLRLKGSSPIPHIELWVPLYLATTLGGGIMLSFLIERPILGLRNRWYGEQRS